MLGILVPLHDFVETKDRQERAYGPKNTCLEPLLKPRECLSRVDQLSEGLVVFSWEAYIHDLVLFVEMF